MEIFIIITLIFAVVVIVLLLRLFRHLSERGTSDQSLLLLQQQLTELRKTLDMRLDESTKRMQMQSGESAKLIRDVTERLTKLDETNKQVVSFTDQLKKLQDTLTNPKQRGVLGEYYLETVLKNVLPPDLYKMQYSFKDGVIVDAVVFIDKRIIPIDSKFSLENYNRFIEARDVIEKRKYESVFINDLKMRIEETSKYIKVGEDTMDFAFMFIPSEAIYYDLLINKIGSTAEDKNLITYAGQKKVIIVSPTSFLAYLQTVLQGLRNQKISEQAKGIIKQVESLGKHLATYDEYMQKLGGHLSTTVSTYNKTYNELKKIDKDVVKMGVRSPGIEPKLIEHPTAHEDLEE